MIGRSRIRSTSALRARRNEQKNSAFRHRRLRSIQEPASQGDAALSVSKVEDAARKDGRRSISHLRRQVARHFHTNADFANFRGRPCHGVVSFCGSASSSFSQEPGAQCKLSRRSNNRQTLAFPVDHGIFTTPPCPGGIADRRWSSSNRAFGKGSPIVDLWWKAVASTGEIHSYWHI
jgi:hypothetical protein